MYGNQQRDSIEQQRREERLNLRREDYQTTNEEDRDNIILLPSSYTGSARYQLRKCQDALAIHREKGDPNVFITMTANPKWREVTENLRPGQDEHDRRDLISRVFRMKVDDMIEKIKNGEVLVELKPILK